MHHIAAFIVIFHITDIWRKEVCASLLSILPYLFDSPCLSVDMVAHASGIAVLRLAVMSLYLGTIVTIIKHHNISVRAHHHAVLLVRPFKRFTDRPEEILLHVLFRPSLRISQNPVEGSCFEVYINHRILMPAGKRDGIRLLIVPYRIIMEPVVCGGRSGPGRLAVVRQNLPVIPGSHDRSRLAVDKGQHIFYGIPVRNLRQHQDIAVFHLKGIMVITARKPVFPVYFSVYPHLIHTAHVIRQLDQPVRTDKQMGVHGKIYRDVYRQIPPYVPAVITCQRIGLRRLCQKNHIVSHMHSAALAECGNRYLWGKRLRFNHHRLPFSSRQNELHRIFAVRIQTINRKNMDRIGRKCMADIAFRLLPLYRQRYLLLYSGLKKNHRRQRRDQIRISHYQRAGRRVCSRLECHQKLLFRFRLLCNQAVFLLISNHLLSLPSHLSHTFLLIRRR